jgi:FkbM family methyltransferase
VIITNEGFAIVENDTHIGKWVMEHKRLDFDINTINQYVKYFKDGDVLLNIGANIGCYVVPFINKASKIICFEPHPHSFNCLQYNLSAYNNIDLYNDAVSDSNNSYEMCFDNANIGASYIQSVSDSNKQTKYIDEFSLDCEGCEFNILNGAQSTIKKHKPIIVMEINEGALLRQNTNTKALFALLDKMNYTYRNIWEDQQMSGPQFDIICFPRN